MNLKVEEFLNSSEDILEINTFHYAMEGANNVSHREEPYSIAYARIMPGKWYGREGYRFLIEDADNGKITILWEGNMLEAVKGQGKVSATICEIKPYMSRYDTTLQFEFKTVAAVDRLGIMAQELDRLYRRYCKRENEQKAKELKEFIMEAADALIDRGYVCLYPLKAVLACSDGWEFYKITDKEKFKSIMKEGFDRHCLRGKPEIAKTWIRNARRVNELHNILNDTVLNSYYKK